MELQKNKINLFLQLFIFYWKVNERNMAVKKLAGESPRSKVHEVNRRIRNQIDEAFEPILYEEWWESQRIVVELEKRFGDEMGYLFTSAVQSGAAGLRLALLTIGIKAGDEVITVANSDMATTASISQCGANTGFM